MAARWYSLNVRMMSGETLEQEDKLEALGLDLPSETETEYIYRPMTINLNHVGHFCHKYDKAGTPDSELTELTFINGISIYVKMPFDEFDKLIRNE